MDRALRAIYLGPRMAEDCPPFPRRTVQPITVIKTFKWQTLSTKAGWEDFIAWFEKRTPPYYFTNQTQKMFHFAKRRSHKKCIYLLFTCKPAEENQNRQKKIRIFNSDKTRETGEESWGVTALCLKIKLINLSLNDSVPVFSADTIKSNYSTFILRHSLLLNNLHSHMKQ